jgi:hypothetical protein
MKKLFFALIILCFAFSAYAFEVEKVAAENDSIHNLTGWTRTTTLYIPSANGTTLYQNAKHFGEFSLNITLSNAGSSDQVAIQPQIGLFGDWEDLPNSTPDTLLYGTDVTDNIYTAYLPLSTNYFWIPMLGTGFRYKCTINDSTNIIKYEMAKGTRDD